MIFSGPISPGGLGSGLASARLHLSPQFSDLQAELAERVAYARSGLADAGVPLAVQSDTPICVIHYDSVPAAQSVVHALRERGFFVCISTFPAVPVNKPSVRFTISRHNSFGDIRALIEALSEVAVQRRTSELVPAEAEPPLAKGA